LIARVGLICTASPLTRKPSMAHLILTAVAEDTIAAPGNVNDSYIVVSVTEPRS